MIKIANNKNITQLERYNNKLIALYINLTTHWPMSTLLY